MKPKLAVARIAFGIGLSATCSIFGQGTIFTYQGRLMANGGAATGLYDLQFAIYKVETNGVLLAGPLTSSAVGVTNGLFTTSLDFGRQVFQGDNRWLEIAVRSSGSANGFVTLHPRVRLSSTPFAISAGGVVDGGITASSLSPGPGGEGQVLQMNNGVLAWGTPTLPTTVTAVGTGTGLIGGPITSSGTVAIDPGVVPLLAGNQSFGGANAFTNPANSFSGDAAGLMNLNADNLSSGTVSDDRLSANVARLNQSQTFAAPDSTVGLRLEGPGVNNWLMLSNGAL